MRYGFLILFLSTLLSSIPCWSANHTLILAGKDEPYFQETVRRLYLMERLHRSHPAHLTVASGEGGGQIVDDQGKNLAPILPARTYWDIERVLSSIGKRLRPNDTLKIIISDHGSPPTSNLCPLSAGIVLQRSTLSLKDFKTLLTQTISPSNRIKLVGGFCFAGGLHAISHALPNVCSASQGDDQSIVHSSLDHSVGYEESFAQYDSSLYAAHLIGVCASPLGDYRSLISSVDYVDSILGRGQYLPPVIPPKSSRRFADFFYTAPTRPCPFQECGLEKVIPDMPALDATLDLLQNQFNTEILNESIPHQRLMEQSHDLRVGVVKSLRGYLERTFNGGERASRLVEKFEAEWKLKNPFSKFFYEDQYEEQYRELVFQEKEKYSLTLRAYRFIESLKSEIEFLKQATPEQKAKYFQLLDCELEAL